MVARQALTPLSKIPSPGEKVLLQPVYREPEVELMKFFRLLLSWDLWTDLAAWQCPRSSSRLGRSLEAAPRGSVQPSSIWGWQSEAASAECQKQVCKRLRWKVGDGQNLRWMQMLLEGIVEDVECRIYFTLFFKFLT